MFDIETALKEKGELIITMDSGERYELHKHNVEFREMDGEKAIYIETAGERELLDESKVEGYKWHFDK